MPAGVGCGGLQRFAEALALTMAGPANSIPTRTPQCGESLGSEARVDGRSFVEVVALGNRKPWRNDVRGLEGDETRRECSRGCLEEIWVLIWGLYWEAGLSMSLCV